jgi:peptidyl-prolyl cis-trans isomerase B (cyclophilin B)
MDETQKFLEQLDLPDLSDQDVVVEMVIQKVSQQEETESQEEDIESQEEDTESQEEDTESQQEEAEGQEEDTGQREKITIQLNTSSAPVTAANFADLVEKNVYDSLAFHRFVEGFVIQGGDPQGRDPDFPIEDLGGGGYIDLETDEKREIPLEIKIAETGEIVYNEETDEPVALSHEAGVIAMARTQELDTASSQFYFALEDISDQLDGGYAVFGKVSDGFDFLQEIQEGDRILIARVVEGNISSRESDLITDSDLFNELANKDGTNKVKYLISMDENSKNNADSDDSTPDIGDPIEPERSQSQITQNEESEDDENQATDGDDVIVINQVDESSVVMGLKGNDEIQGSDGNDLISGNQGNDSLLGLEGNDWLRGGKGDDTLIGGMGDDYLIGDHGTDILTGGAGADSFILRSNTAAEIEEIEQADMITDFSVVENDRIIVIAEFTSYEGLGYELIDTDTVIILLDNSFILGVVEKTSIENVENNILVVNSDDYALRLG